ncbi:T9SS type A sorting domain-containing protein [Flavobacterium sp.]|uniref:T9SS type A sorting domain-containing protein n=1 Tax=Flavobacterium sp. TaxID=239 RepID=UPI002612490B|nr:T9SS type A sorting domain-containing protein [Flavobacterium sp.]
MKKLYILLLAVVSSASFGQTFYSENFGTATGTLAIADNVFENGAPIAYSGTADVRSSLASSGYNGASGVRNVFINAIDEYFQIDGLNTSAYNTADLQLSFGINTPTAVTNVLTVEVSTNGTNWAPITYTPSGTGWTLATISGGVIPSSGTLSIRFKSSTILQYRIDDVKLSSVSASCTLALGTATASCDGFNLGTDTYTVTIPFTGAGNAAYAITPNAGVVGGDNPNAVAAGNIVITGVPEGTAFSATIIGGTCNTSAAVNSPECKPINILPLRDHFNYADGASLGAQEQWTNINSGDNILAVAGSLSYPNATSSGNAVSFTGSGIDCFSPFTATNSGTLYASFMMSVTDLALAADAAETYFAALSDASRSFKARMFFKRTGTQYQLGFDAPSFTTNYDATLRNVGDVVFVVMGYDFNTNTLNAWLNPDLTSFSASTPATLTVTPATAITELGGFILRQDNNPTPTMTIDELTIATSTSELLAVKQNAIAGLEVYPNPVTNGTLFINTQANAEKNIVIFDVLGKQVFNTTTANNAINVSSLNKGVYILKITEAGKTATSKLVVR